MCVTAVTALCLAFDPEAAISGSCFPRYVHGKPSSTGKVEEKDTLLVKYIYCSWYRIKLLIERGFSLHNFHARKIRNTLCNMHLNRLMVTLRRFIVFNRKWVGFQ